MSRRVSLIGAPTDIGASTRGASMGPEALRVAGLKAMLESQGLVVTDRGNLNGPGNPGLPPANGYRHLAEVTEWSRLVCEAVREDLGAGRLPVVLGGDHSLAIGSISAVARHCRESDQRLRVLWLDAHADFNTQILTPSGNIHGMPVACLCGYGPPELIGLGGTAPAITPAMLRQIGIRSVDQGEKRLDTDTHLHVSFDVDFLDPDIAPGVLTTVPGGPSYREAQLCMEMIADTGRLGSLDVMELNPALDVRNRTAQVAVDLIGSLFGKSTLMRR
jgi:arginase